MNRSDRSRYALAVVLLLVIGGWLVVDISRGNWGLVLFRCVFAVVIVAAILTLARLRKHRSTPTAAAEPPGATEAPSEGSPSWPARVLRRVRGR